MHGSTRKMVDHLTAALVARDVRVKLFNLAVTDIGKLAMAPVDAATIVVGTPTVLAGPHPLVAHATFLANALRPKAQYLSIIGSYGWCGKTVERLGRDGPQSQGRGVGTGPVQRHARSGHLFCPGAVSRCYCPEAQGKRFLIGTIVETDGGEVES
jgi:hypothetical protein